MTSASARAGMLLAALGAFGAAGCQTPEGTFAAAVSGGIVGTTLAGAQAPAHELEQIYYVGTYDKYEQVDPQVYRIRVRGQASAISQARYASGWVPAAVIDALNSQVGFNDESGMVEVTTGEKKTYDTFEPGRGLMMFGPEGFREAPRNHRLVIVMGQDPHKFFRAIDQSLGVVAKVRDEQRQAALSAELFRALSTVTSERGRLEDLAGVLKSDQDNGN